MAQLALLIILLATLLVAGLGLAVSGYRSGKFLLLWGGVAITTAALGFAAFAAYKLLFVLPCWAGGTCT